MGGAAQLFEEVLLRHHLLAFNLTSRDFVVSTGMLHFTHCFRGYVFALRTDRSHPFQWSLAATQPSNCDSVLCWWGKILFSGLRCSERVRGPGPTGPRDAAFHARSNHRSRQHHIQWPAIGVGFRHVGAFSVRCVGLANSSLVSRSVASVFIVTAVSNCF